MKLDFYFIHGWGFDKFFWYQVGKKFEEDSLSRNLKILDLGFISEENYFNNEFLKNDSKSIFIVHSYGLNWFLKKQIKCKLLINFFGAPSFLKFQENPNITKKIMVKMVEKFPFDPSGVLKDFYKKCNVFYDENIEIDVDKCLVSLKELLDEDLTKNFNNLNCKVFSIFSKNDNILNLNNNFIKLKKKNHNINFVPNLEHGFPKNCPELCYEMIKKILIRNLS